MCRWSRRGVSLGSVGVSGLNRSSSCPIRSPASVLPGNIDSLPGQVALAQPLSVRCCPGTSSAAGECLARPLPDASDLTWCSRAPPAPLAGRCVLRQRARHHPLLGAQQAPHLQRLGAAVRRPMPLSEGAKRQCGVGRPCGRGCGAQTPGYARCAALLRDSRCTRVRRLYEKVARFGEIVYG